MVFEDFLREMLGIIKDFRVVKIYKEESSKRVIEIHLQYIPTSYKKENVPYKLYDFTPQRKWQHLSWFDYKCYIVCQLPRYIDKEGKPKIIDISFAPKGKGYTHLFAQHIFKKLSEAIDKTRKKEVKENELLKKHKYTVLKNKEDRTEKQEIAFEEIDKANLNTAKAWHIRENFKTLFNIENKHQIEQLFEEWMIHSKQVGIKYVNTVIATFDRHKKEILNAFKTRTDSGKHENLNGRIQSVLAKARGFVNFDRFRINVLFYFGKLELLPQKFTNAI